MSLLLKPQGLIPLGVAIINGQRFPVSVDLQWDQFFTALTERAGGITGVSTTELVESSFEDAGISEMQAQMFAMDAARMQDPIREQVAIDAIDNTAELHARISAMETELQALRQGLYS
jgi:hypothetical protein